MAKRVPMIAAAFIVLLAAGFTMAEDQPPAGADGQMPVMGAPEEMKECSKLVGNWESTSKWRWSPEAEWQTSKGNASYEMILDGGALLMKFTDNEMMPGFAFEGWGIQTYDRETKQWQMTWTDNMACRTSLYAGAREGDKTILSGEDKMGGMTWLSRITTSNETDTSFDWTMENSMDGGQTWFISGEAHYTKVK